MAGKVCIAPECSLIVFNESISKDQEERHWAVRQFKEGKKDVLIATDVASKGLDFPDIQHVINYDMPEDMESYGMVSLL
jgi:ERCC4-related helicase